MAHPDADDRAAPLIARHAPRLSTGMKMLLIMTAALLPLGLITVFASIESAQTNRLRREADARQMASQSARQLSAQVARLSLDLREAVIAIGSAGAPGFAQRCDAALRGLALAQRFEARFALFSNGGLRLCASPGFSAAPARPPTMVFATEVRLAPPARALRFEARNADSGLFGIGELPLRTLADVTRPATFSETEQITLAQGGDEVRVAESSRMPLGRRITVAAPVAAGQVALLLTTVATPITAIEVLMALLPILMWLAAAMIGWFVVDRLLIRPLLQLQHAISAYHPGAPLALPALTTPAQEIRELGRAFQTVTGTIEAHELELEQGLARQTKLTREVHHRVKNNLQVVSSLINLHSRGVEDQAVANAYASIQRRVDALAVVHRNHYAELEENRGVGLRALIGELASNLRATAPRDAQHLAITLDVIPAFAHQDVAVPVAFLITELIELAMTCDARGRIAIALAETDRPARALLTVTAPGLSSELCEADPSYGRFARVIEGLSRQLRAKLQIDPAIGSYAIELTIAPAGELASSH